MKIKNPRIVVIMTCFFLIQFLNSPTNSKNIKDEKKTKKETITQNDNNENWIQYRGPNRDGVATSKVKIKSWKGEQPHEVWKKQIGEGFSGMSISGDILLTSWGEDSIVYLVACDKLTGKENWRFNMGNMFYEELGNGPRSTPTIEGDLAYMLNSNGGLYCVNIKTGKQVWMVSLTETFKVKRPFRGFSTSPHIVGETLMMHVGGKNSAIVGFNKKTGGVIWQTGDGIAGHSSQFTAVINHVEQNVFTLTKMAEINGERQMVNEAVSVSNDGKILWTGPSLAQIIAMPVFVPPNKVFISSSVEEGCLLIEVFEDGTADTVWHNREMRNHFNSSIYYKGHIYGFDNATLECLVAETSERKWKKRGFGKGSLIIVNEKILVLSDKGKFGMIEATPKGYKELARAQVLKGKSWTMPTYSNGKVYLRNQKEMACYDLTK